MSIFKKIKEHEEAAPATKATLSRSIVSTAFILTILTVAVVAYITSAWFSNNRKVDNTGVHINVQTSPNMFIVNGDASATTYGVLSGYTSHDAPLRVAFNDSHYNGTGDEILLVPVTRTIPSPYSHTTSDVGLYYLHNPSIIDRDSGVKTKDDYDLYPVDPANNSNPQYYLEHKVLISSTDGELSASALNATICAYATSVDPSSVDPEDHQILTIDTTNNTSYNTTDDSAADYKYAYNHTQLQSDSTNMYQYAVSVDFYAKAITKQTFNSATNAADLTVSSGDYKGTLNLARKNENWNILSSSAGNVVSTNAHDTIPLMDTDTVLDNNSTPDDDTDDVKFEAIPHNNAAENNDYCCILVVMRFYFDGALLWTQTVDNTQEPAAVTPGIAYVHSAYLDIDCMPNLNVKFTAEP